MDIFILDNLLRPVDVVDVFESILWTERWVEAGDFELHVPSTPANRNRFVADTLLAIPDSKGVMMVQTTEEVDDYETGKLLKVKGQDLKGLLKKRLAARVDIEEPFYIRPYWKQYGFTPRELVERMFSRQCIEGAITTGDIIPFVQDLEDPGLYPPDNIDDPFPEGVKWNQKLDTLYNACVDVCNAYDIGMRFYKDPNASKLYFEAYAGCDRTSQQTDFPPVIFSHDMNNLMGTTAYNDDIDHYNAIAVVYTFQDEASNEDAISVVVSDPALDLSPGGIDQKTKLVKVTEVPEDLDETEIVQYLTEYGYQELMRSRPIFVYDGEISQGSDFVYERDYNLGDLVEVRGDNGGTAYMRVVEQIIKEDKSGKSSYPSLVSRVSINPGTWASWKYDVEWSAMGSEEYWANQ